MDKKFKKDLNNVRNTYLKHAYGVDNKPIEKQKIVPIDNKIKNENK